MVRFADAGCVLSPLLGRDDSMLWTCGVVSERCGSWWLQGAAIRSCRENLAPQTACMRAFTDAHGAMTGLGLAEREKVRTVSFQSPFYLKEDSVEMLR